MDFRPTDVIDRFYKASYYEQLVDTSFDVKEIFFLGENNGQ